MGLKSEIFTSALIGLEGIAYTRFQGWN